MRLGDFDYSLPPALIAQHPPDRRGSSRLLVLDRKAGSRAHRSFQDIPEYLNPGDVLVVNDTRVLPARLIGRKESGGKVEVLLVRKREGGILNAVFCDVFEMENAKIKRLTSYLTQV